MSDLFDDYYTAPTSTPEPKWDIHKLQLIANSIPKLPPIEKDRCKCCRAWFVPGVVNAVEIVSGNTTFAPALAYVCGKCAAELVAFSKSEQAKKVNKP